MMRILLLLLVIMFSGCATHSSRRSSSLDKVGSKIERIALALQEYQTKTGQLPKRLSQLIPKYLSHQDLTFSDGLQLPTGLEGGIVYLPQDQIADPDHRGITMIGFTSTELDSGGRYVIDNRFKAWFVGEGRFQNWLLGKKTY